jgi:iron complex outermembrane recepter protein
MRKAALLLGAAMPFAVILSAPAAAQETAADEAYVERGDIIVTARRRQESILQVPVVETVISAETLSRNQVVDVRGLTQQVAGLAIGGNVLTVGTQIALRGVGTSSLDAGVDQSVSLNIDGLQITQGASYDVGMFDMQQVEVLKGPQALFFGKNSPGGVIAIRTADPGDELEVIARALYGFEAQTKRGELIYSSPLSDTVGLRLAGMYSNDNGYFFNKATAAPGLGGKDPSSNRYNATEEYILRGTLLWNPSDDVRVRFKANHTAREVIGGGSPLGSCPDGVGAPLGIPFINPNENCRVDRDYYIVDLDTAAFPDARNNGVPFLRYLTTFGTLELDYDVGPGMVLTSTSGFYDHKVDGFLNGVNSGSAGPSLTSDNRFKRRDFTQEVRLQSDWNTPFNFLLGGFYQDARVRNTVFVAGNTAIGLPRVLVAGTNDVSIETLSAFGQLRWKPVETLEIAAGARYADERRENTASSISSYFGSPTPTPLLRPNLRAKNWSPEFTITYTPTDDLTVFGALKQGYKSGSFIMTVPATPNTDNSFGDERVRGGEVGIKARAFDRSLNINIAGYYYKYDDLQVGANEQAAGGLPVIRTINAASSKVYGIDFDASYAPRSVPGLTARLAVNYNHARFEEFNNSPCYGGQRVQDGCNLFFAPFPVSDPFGGPTQGNPGLGAVNVGGQFGLYKGQDLSGAPLPKAADWTITGGFDYEMPVGRDLKLSFGSNVQYSSRFLRGLGRFDGIPGLTQPAFAKINANLMIGADDDRWELALIGNNVTNKFTSGNCTTFSAATGQVLLAPLTGGTTRNAAGLDELACIPDRGREVFLRLTLRPAAF